MRKFRHDDDDGDDDDSDSEQIGSTDNTEQDAEDAGRDYFQG